MGAPQLIAPKGSSLGSVAAFKRALSSQERGKAPKEPPFVAVPVIPLFWHRL